MTQLEEGRTLSYSQFDFLKHCQLSLWASFHPLSSSQRWQSLCSLLPLGDSRQKTGTAGQSGAHLVQLWHSERRAAAGQRRLHPCTGRWSAHRQLWQRRRLPLGGCWGWSLHLYLEREVTVIWYIFGCRRVHQNQILNRKGRKLKHLFSTQFLFDITRDIEERFIYPAKPSWH